MNSKERQRLEALHRAAMAPRRSWLAKPRPRLTAIQSAWIKSLLTVWGDIYGGRLKAEYAYEEGGCSWSGACPTEWTDAQAMRVTEAIHDLRAAGFRGKELLEKLHGVLWPSQSICKMIMKYEKRENEDFIERAILSSMNKNTPIYIVGEYYYAKRKTITEIGRYLQEVAPMLTRKMAEDRARWCLDLFRAAVYYAMKAMIYADNTKIKKIT